MCIAIFTTCRAPSLREQLPKLTQGPGVVLRSLCLSFHIDCGVSPLSRVCREMNFSDVLTGPSAKVAQKNKGSPPAPWPDLPFRACPSSSRSCSTSRALRVQRQCEVQGPACSWPRCPACGHTIPPVAATAGYPLPHALRHRPSLVATSPAPPVSGR